MTTIKTKIEEEILNIELYLEDDEGNTQRNYTSYLDITSELNKLEDVSKVKKIFVNIYDKSIALYVDANTLFDDKSLELLNNISNRINYNLIVKNKINFLWAFNFHNIYVYHAEDITIEVKTKNLFINISEDIDTNNVEIMNSYISTLEVSGKTIYKLWNSYIKEVFYSSNDVYLTRSSDFNSYVGNMEHSLFYFENSCLVKLPQGNITYKYSNNYLSQIKTSKTKYLKRYLDENITY